MARLKVVTKQAPSSLELDIDTYLDWCQRTRDLSPRSVEAYSNPLRKVFLPWVLKQGVTRLEDVDQGMLDTYTATLNEASPTTGRPLAKASVHSYLRPLRQLLNWGRDKAKLNIAADVKPEMPKPIRRTLDVFSVEEMDTMVKAAGNDRDRLIVRILSETGLRMGELLALTVDDLVKEDRRYYLLVREGKGGDGRKVSIEVGLYRDLIRYYERVRPKDTHPKERRLFLSLRRDRRSGKYEPITKTGITLMLRSLGARAEIRMADKRCHAHMFRHSFVTDCLRKGMGPMQVAQVVGHKSLRMIEDVYSHLTTEDSHDALMEVLSARRRR